MEKSKVDFDNANIDRVIIYGGAVRDGKNFNIGKYKDAVKFKKATTPPKGLRLPTIVFDEYLNI